MLKRKVIIINRTKFKTKDIEEITLGLLAGQLAPDFYLICEEQFSCKGIALSNLDKPTIIIFIRDLGQFAETFVHELVHIQQHSKNYTDEKEAEEREIVVSDINQTITFKPNHEVTNGLPPTVETVGIRPTIL